MDELTVDRVTGTDYLNIIYRSENPQMSAFVVNTLGKEFISFFTSIMTTRTTESAGKLDTLAARKRKEIDDKTRQLSEYKKSFNSPNINDRSTAALEMVKDQQSQLSAEMAKLNGLKADLVSVAQKLQSMGSGADNTSAINTELLELQQKNRDLAVDLQKKGGSDASIEALIAANQKRIAQLQPSYSSAADRAERRKRIEDLTLQKISINNDIEAQNQTIGSLQAGLRNYNTIASSGAGAEVIADAIQIDIDRLNKEYEQMTHQLQNAENVNVAPEINFKQTLVGQAAIKPERSGRKMIIAVTSLAALMISSLWIIIMDFLDQSVRTPSLFNKLVNLRLLAITSKIDLKNRIMDDYFSVQADPKNDDSAFSYLDSLRKLRYEIEASGKKIILFTSTKPQEGKSTIIEGLANSFSLSRKKVLLIDTNFSNNSLTEKFQAKPLLDQFSLNGAANVMEKLASIKSSTKIPSVDIIGCKETALSPDELLRENNLLENLSSVSQSYDYVFLEGAALNNHADTKELLKYADAVIVVFSAGSVIRQTDKDAIRFLKSNKEKLVGAVLNGVEKDNIDM
jgi:Mrp family chromosome partitioning ATPase/capsular polysaccharide biosynthesis protein